MMPAILKRARSSVFARVPFGLRPQVISSRPIADDTHEMTSERRRKSVTVEAYGSLCDFIDHVESEPHDTRVCRKSFFFDTSQTAKDAIESSGIPHPEVDLLLVNGTSRGFDAETNDGDQIQVYSREHPAVHLHPSYVRPEPLSDIKFLVDENSGKLASALLLLGFDTKIDSRLNDADLARISNAEKRILLTRDIGLLKRSLVVHGYWLRSDNPRDQILTIVRRYDLWPIARPITRCLECNCLLQPVAKEEVVNIVPPVAHATYNEFFLCPNCGKAFWKGSHYQRMQLWLDDLRERLKTKAH